jgi:hypothetical protein
MELLISHAAARCYPIKELPAEPTPRERLLSEGPAEALSRTELPGILFCQRQESPRRRRWWRT